MKLYYLKFEPALSSAALKTIEPRESLLRVLVCISIIRTLGFFKPFFNNTSVSQQTKTRAFNAIIRSVCTYAIPVWGAASTAQINRLQSTYMRILRSSLNIPWFIRNTHILHETGDPGGSFSLRKKPK